MSTPNLESPLVHPEWIILYKKSVTSGQYRIDLTSARLRFTNLMMSKGQLYHQDDHISDIDLQIDPHSIQFNWLLPSPFVILTSTLPGGILISLKNGHQIMVPGIYNWATACVDPYGKYLAVVKTVDSRSMDPKGNRVAQKDGSKSTRPSRDKYPIVVFDFSNPVAVPYPEIQVEPFPSIGKANMSEINLDWADSSTLRITLPVAADPNDELNLGYEYFAQDVLLKVLYR